jgi:hypothetical protein
MEDNTGKKCKKCGKGIYREMNQLDDLKGVLHCDKCNDEINRYTRIKDFEDFSKK